MSTPTTAEVALSKLATLTGGTIIADFLSVKGSMSNVHVRAEEGRVTLDSSWCVTEGPWGARRVRNIGCVETLPAGLTYSQIAAQVLVHANTTGWTGLGIVRQY
jgi:hypothetical protein